MGLIVFNASSCQHINGQCRKIIWEELLKILIPRVQPPEFDSVPLRTTELTGFFRLIPVLNSGFVNKDAAAPPRGPEQLVQPHAENWLNGCSSGGTCNFMLLHPIRTY